MNEKRLQKILSNSHIKETGSNFNLKNLAISINIESQSYEIFQWKKEDEIKLDLKKLIKEKISDEVADIMLYLLDSQI